MGLSFNNYRSGLKNMTDITRENIILKGIAATVLTICTVVVAIKITADLANIPDVYVSNSTQECVKVLNYVEHENYTCDDMPSRYNQVWVR